jgi:hypothetical protein
MSLESRIARLENRHGDGRCPGCGFRPDDVRTIVVRTIVVVGSRPRQEGSVPPLCEFAADGTDQPGRPRCAVCNGFMPPIAIIGVGPDEPPDDAGEGSGDG